MSGQHSKKSNPWQPVINRLIGVLVAVLALVAVAIYRAKDSLTQKQREAPSATSGAGKPPSPPQAATSSSVQLPAQVPGTPPAQVPSPPPFSFNQSIDQTTTVNQQVGRGNTADAPIATKKKPKKDGSERRADHQQGSE
jgi:hypothetical protein